MWKVRPVGGSSMLVMNLGCSPHFKQRGEIGFGRACFPINHSPAQYITRDSGFGSGQMYKSEPIELVWHLTCRSFPPRNRGKTTLHILVEGFSVLGVEFQYWMPIAVLIVAASVAFTVRTN